MDLTDLLRDTGTTDEGGRHKEAGCTERVSMLPGRDEIGDDINWGDTGMIDHVLQGRSIEGAETISIRGITEASRVKGALALPVRAGTRVAFVVNLSSVLSYADIPDGKTAGTVVTVRSADGDVTASEAGVHVMWDDGQFRPILAQHLRLAPNSDKKASLVRMSFASFGDLSGFFEPALWAGLKTASDSDLIHKATKDLWAFKQEGGQFVIERLFNADGKPLKE